MVVNTTLKNKYKKYFELNEKEWHEYKIGTYHVSGIGNSHILQQICCLNNLNLLSNFKVLKDL